MSVVGLGDSLVVGAIAEERNDGSYAVCETLKHEYCEEG